MITEETFNAILLLSTFFIPIILGYMFWHLWLQYVRTHFLLAQEHILLEFKLPREITKSPAAMEIFLSTLYQTGSESTWFDRYWKGGMRPWFSLELVSIEGQVKFFIWTRKGLKKTIETQLYSQYPDIEVAEVPDYTEGISFEPGVNDIFGCYFVKDKESFYPIKTYIDFGLDKDPKEEVKIDPITPVLEFLGSIGEGEQVWFQIMVRAHKKESIDPTSKEKVDWRHFAKEEINLKMKRNKGEGESGDRLTKGEKNAIEAVERSIAKLPFDVGIRAIYIADKDKANKDNIPGLRGAFRQYGAVDLNNIKPDGSTSFDYPWQDFMDIRLNEKKRKILSGYKNRAYFRPAYPNDAKYSIFSVEELATIFHFPGKVAHTPTMSRISSKKGEAPSNLPI